jgi:NADH dehydrogenase
LIVCQRRDAEQTGSSHHRRWVWWPRRDGCVGSGDKPVPGIAPAALQSGRQAAANIANRIEGRPTAPFRYRDKGTLATIGRSAAVADLGRLRFSGYFAWVFWWLVHVFFLIGFHNRFLVMFSWA